MNPKEKLRSIALALSDIQDPHSTIWFDPKDATAIDDLCSGIIENTAAIAAEARKRAGNTSGKGLVTRIRRALGYTYP